MPIAVLAPDPDGAVAAALAGSHAQLMAPVPAAAASAGLIVRGIETAAASVAATTAALVWPVRMAWIDAGTATALIEAHARDAEAAFRPAWAGEPGWPALLPLVVLDALRTLPTDLPPDLLLAGLQAAGVPLRTLDLGDPGATHDVDTSRARLPVYVGPDQPIPRQRLDLGSDTAEPLPHG